MHNALDLMTKLISCQLGQSLSIPNLIPCESNLVSKRNFHWVAAGMYPWQVSKMDGCRRYMWQKSNELSYFGWKYVLFTDNLFITDISKIAPDSVYWPWPWKSCMYNRRNLSAVSINVYITHSRPKVKIKIEVRLCPQLEIHF